MSSPSLAVLHLSTYLPTSKHKEICEVIFFLKHLFLLEKRLEGVARMLQPTSKQGDAEFKRGLRILEQDALSVGETLEDWAKHISAGCGWSDERLRNFFSHASVNRRGCWPTSAYPGSVHYLARVTHVPSGRGASLA